MRRRRARRNLLDWCIEALAPRGIAPAAHHRLLVTHLQSVANRQTQRLLVLWPPGSGKSTYVSQLFPAWLLAQGWQVIGASHTAELADDFSGRVQALIREHSVLLGCGLASEHRGRWYTTNHGAYLAAGVGGAIPGFRADCAIVDDPIKGRAAANSEAERKRVWDWYLGDLERRLTPGAPVVLMHTRWHEDDLAGRLLQAEGDRWQVLSLPAEAEADDPLGRHPGEWLWTDDAYGYGAELRQIRDKLHAAGASGEWWSQYQQSPRQPDGAVFRVGRIVVIPAAPSGGRWVRGWDLAATAQSGNARDPDWTRGVLLQETEDQRYIIRHVESVRGGPDEVEKAILATAQHDGTSVRIGLPQDPGQAGKTQALYYVRRLAGYQVVVSPESGDKAERAAPLASQCNGGNLAVVDGPWVRPLLDELGAFPNGRHDDQVDASSRAFSVLVEPMPGQGLIDYYRERVAADAARRNGAGT